MRRVVMAVALLFGLNPALATGVRGLPQIVDADTVYIGQTKIRFSGVDAPETEQICLDSAGKNWKCGLEAKERLQAFSNNREWVCQLSGQDVYRRSLGVCTINGENVSRWLVRNGWALDFHRYSTDFVDDEDFAREHRRGLWSGAFIAPWDWRHRNPATVVLGALAVPTNAQRALIAHAPTDETPHPSNCVIKGNLASAPQCIYHLPGGRFYDRLRMQPTSSRRWFCSEAEAQAAGCRKSKL
ncbi:MULTISPECIES: thermonuclease family protein [unclassified Bradyrhizobium]|uniref:thermonuclease family protein n=1 Tax=Bradyrhizobium sp. USDA 4541 TaxID=2817704 RepID=UPI0020A3002A|nr:thermonuclease family protein [Bradyrhizobium sp. USDA 4541]MCP1849393.1 endonuclease YncB(thermonuclease family) [Bradyrhizobium sp. USDA 4541]